MEQKKANVIMIRSLFRGWCVATEDNARNWASQTIRAITTCKSNAERLVLVNNRLQGIKFTLEDLGMRDDR